MGVSMSVTSSSVKIERFVDSSPAHAARRAVLDAAYTAAPERFVRRAPTPPPVPVAAWINKPDNEEAAH